MTFQPGQSGNPAGRPKGARGKAAIFAEGLFEGEAEEIIREAVKMAKGGDITEIRVCLDRIAPRRRDRAVPFELPALHSAESALSALADIAAAVSRGDLTPAEADNISKLLDRYVRTLEHVEFDQRLAKLERDFGASTAKSSHDGQNGQYGQYGHEGHDGQASPANQAVQRAPLDPDSLYNFGDAP
jgi:hypothetical protein